MIPYGKHTNMDIKDLKNQKPLQWFISNKIINTRKRDMDKTNTGNNTHQGKETQNYTKNENRIKHVTSAGNPDI